MFVVQKSWKEQGGLPPDCSIITVEDTLRAYGDLAHFHRKKFSFPVLAITGSNGKTTTKEMLAAILDQTAKGLKTIGNFNNLIGLPNMLLQLQEEHRWAILEMGMSELGEIDRLSEIASPDVGIITNALPAHLETLKNVENVAKAKGELFRRLRGGSHAIYNADDDLVSRCPSPEGVVRVPFGINSGETRAEEIASFGKSGQRFTLCLPSGKITVTLSAFGLHNVYNALAAATAAFVLDVDPAVIKSGLETFRPYHRRFSVEEVDGITLIDDCYNANPGSMKAALVTLRDMKGKNRGIAVLGDMLELGAASESAHAELGKVAASCVEKIYVMGEMADKVAQGAFDGGVSAVDVIKAADHAELLTDLLQTVRSGDYLLVKGSRGMKMEVVADAIRELRNSGKKGAAA